MLKNFKNIFWFFSKEGIEVQRKNRIKKRCKHEHWNCDTQIRVIECTNCGLRARIIDYVDLFKKSNNKNDFKL